MSKWDISKKTFEEIKTQKREKAINESMFAAGAKGCGFESQTLPRLKLHTISI